VPPAEREPARLILEDASAAPLSNGCRLGCHLGAGRKLRLTQRMPFRNWCDASAFLRTSTR
jgi:hypothetical protein